MINEHEGLVITCDRQRFYIKNGRRVWLEKPPAERLPDLLGYNVPDDSHEINRVQT